VEFRRKPRLTPREISLLSLIGFVAVILISVLVGVNIGLSRSVGGGGGFYSPWDGARQFLFSHVNPYNLDVALQSQQLAYGRPASAGQIPYDLTVPFFLLPLYFPFAYISDTLFAVFPSRFVVDPTVVRGLWMFLNEGALLATAFLILRLVEWPACRIFLVAFFLLSVFSFYSVSALLDGTPVIFLGLLYFGILYALQNEQDELAGALLVLTFFRWEAGLLFFVYVVWRVYSEKRLRVFYGFGMLMLVLLIASFLMNPGWVIPFLQSCLADLRASYGFTSGAVLLRLWPSFDPRLTWMIPVGLLLLLGYEWYASHGRDFRHFIWTACFTLAITPLIGFRTDLVNLVVLFPALALIFATVAVRRRYGYVLAGLLYLIVLLLPWGFFIRSVVFQSPFYLDLLFLFYPLFTLVGLYWTRWWFIRPPRTWLGEVRTARA
jgi:hypothetical protein